jgi:hypothetical protein
MDHEREQDTQPAPDDDETPTFAQGETPSEEELADPDVGGTAGGGPAGA